MNMLMKDHIGCVAYQSLFYRIKLLGFFIANEQDLFFQLN